MGTVSAVVLLVVVCGTSLFGAGSTSAAEPTLQIQSEGLVGPPSGKGGVTIRTLCVPAIAPGASLVAVTDGVKVVLFDGVNGRLLRRWTVPALDEHKEGQVCFADSGEHLLFRKKADLSGNFSADVTLLFRTTDGALVKRHEDTKYFDDCIDGIGFFAGYDYVAVERGRLGGAGLARPLPDVGALGNIVNRPERRVVGRPFYVEEGSPTGLDTFAVEGGRHVVVTEGATRWDDLVTARIYARNSGVLLRGIDRIQRPPSNALTVSADARWLAYRSYDRDSVQLVDMASQRAAPIAALENFGTKAVTFLNDGNWILATSDDRWMVVDRQSQRVARQGKGYAAVDPTGRILLVADLDRSGHVLLSVPALEPKAHIASVHAPIDSIVMGSSELYLGTANLIKRIGLTRVGFDLDVAAADSFFVSDRVTGRLAYLAPDDKLTLLTAAGTRIAIELPSGEVATQLLFIPGKELLIAAVSTMDAKRMHDDRALPLTPEPRNVRFRLYLVDEAGRALHAFEAPRPADAMHVTGDGRRLWIYAGSRLAAYRLPDFELEAEMTGPRNVRYMTSNADGSVIITVNGTFPSRIMAWDVASRTQIGDYSSDRRSAIQYVTLGDNERVLFAEGRQIISWQYRSTPGAPDLPDRVRIVSPRWDRYVRADPEAPTVLEVGTLPASTGKTQRIPHERCARPVAFSWDSRYLLCAPQEELEDRTYAVLDASNGAVVRQFEHFGSRGLPAFAVDSLSVLYRNLDDIVAVDLVSGKTQTVMKTETGEIPDQISRSSDGRRIALRIVNSGAKDRTVHVLELKEGAWLLVARIPSPEIWSSLSLSPDGKRVAIGTPEEGVSIYATDGGARLNRFDVDVGSALSGGGAYFVEDGKSLVVLSRTATNVIDAASGEIQRRFPQSGRLIGDRLVLIDRRGNVTVEPLHGGSRRTVAVADADLWIAHELPQGFLLGARSDGLLGLWAKDEQRPLAHIAMTRRGNWVVVDRDGRFDASTLDDLELLHWVRPQEPFCPLPLELFMRDYYEPKLLHRLLNGEKLRPVRTLDTLNLVQPSVVITEIKPENGVTGRVSITVEVSGGESVVERNGRPEKVVTGVHDLRVFRDGRLVAVSPEAGGEIRLDPLSRKARITFSNVRLPLGGGSDAVEFSAYAFNDDRIKSGTARMRYALPSELAKGIIKGRAYVLTIGVDAYENPAWNLAFAVNDARKLESELVGRLRSRGTFSEVVPIALHSETFVPGAPGQATKGNVKTVLDLLAGSEVSPQALALVPNSQQIRAATPDDIVIVGFAGHGYAGERGEFYLLTSDMGAHSGRVLSAAQLSRAVSSDELSLWLRRVDAGELALVLDACHSAASVEGEGFKPGPMGSRGLGQLAYDKGMRILAASQADDVALESDLIKQGLLSFALVTEGLIAGRADFKPRDEVITLDEWFAYAVQRVPALAREVSGGRVQTQNGARALVLVASGSAVREKREIQQPVLFDFALRRVGLRLQ